MALVAIVGDVGGEVGVVAVGFDDDAVLVVAVVGGGEPGGAVLLVDVAAFTQIGDCALDLAVLVQAVLMEPDVEAHAEVLHRLADLGEHHRHGALAELLALRRVALAERVAVGVHAAVHARQAQHVHAVGLGLVDHTLGDLVDVCALVPVGRAFLAVGGGHQGLGEAVDLFAVVVEVVFAHHRGAVGFQHAGHRIADGGPAGAADVDRSGGVGGDELQVQRLAAQMTVPAERGTLGQDLVHHGRSGGGVEGDVDEAGARHLNGFDAFGVGERGRERLGQVTRLHAGLLGQLHGDVGRPVAVCAILRAHDGQLVHGRNQVVGQIARLALRDKVMGDGGNQFTQRFWTHGIQGYRAA